MAKIYLVAGHGGRDSGATGHGRLEKNDTLDMALDVGKALTELGHEVKYNRTTDVDTDYYGYIAACNEFGADICMSLHRNAFNGNAYGYETCVHANNGTAKVIADYLNKEMAELGFSNRGTKIRPDLAILNMTNMPAVLPEVGFIDNAGDNEIFVEKYDQIISCLVNAVLAGLGEGEVVIDKKPASVIPSAPSGNTKKDLGKVNCTYQVFTDQWWPIVKNYEDWAGKGDGVPIRYLGICVDKGTIRARVHTIANGWLPAITFGKSYNINDLSNGVVGDGTPIDAIELYYITPDGYEYQKAVYCVSSTEGEEFYPVQYDNEKGNGMDGYAGAFGLPVDKFKAWIE